MHQLDVFWLPADPLDSGQVRCAFPKALAGKRHGSYGSAERATTPKESKPYRLSRKSEKSSSFEDLEPESVEVAVDPEERN